MQGNNTGKRAGNCSLAFCGMRSKAPVLLPSDMEWCPQSVDSQSIIPSAGPPEILLQPILFCILELLGLFQRGPMGCVWDAGSPGVDGAGMWGAATLSSRGSQRGEENSLCPLRPWEGAAAEHPGVSGGSFLGFPMETGLGGSRECGAGTPK